MRIKKVALKEGAVFIADVHYKRGDRDFLELLKHWIKNPPSQVFFLGDIFHLLVDFKFLREYNKEAIELINKLSKKTEIYYTPGNHDFNIEKIFPDVIFADAFVDEEKSVFLTHGDLTDRDFFYRVYVRVIRSNFFLNLINFFTFNFKKPYIFKKILQKKIKCIRIPNFKLKVFSKIADIDFKIIIEGHYHQSEFYKFENKIYYALASFYCSKKIYRFIKNEIKVEDVFGG